ncbi:hypothetical protein [Chitinophaga qingshengii]|uniref:Gluconate 2-dehydrogenase subunit 3 family protein n=1 Tax=Chitinophaga qingshengii TaxID=1569794 RepID=A0ABR7TQA0_9BACT|nr:hypothetical protein [Chitinophaga qingshengii]MBC9931194.1 hypothetical protein [Chitinophaga qingshengii]
MEANNKNTKTFLQISVHLTGYDEMDLLGTGMLESYYDVVIHENNLHLVSEFLTTSEKILGDLPNINDKIRQQLIDDVKFNSLTSNIIMMWYMGTWNGNVVSPQSYIQGLVWKAADTHPPGAKQPGYGSWENPPITIHPPVAVKPAAKAETLTTV